MLKLCGYPIPRDLPVALKTLFKGSGAKKAKPKRQKFPIDWSFIKAMIPLMDLKNSFTDLLTLTLCMVLTLGKGRPNEATVKSQKQIDLKKLFLWKFLAFECQNGVSLCVIDRSRDKTHVTAAEPCVLGGNPSPSCKWECPLHVVKFYQTKCESLGLTQPNKPIFRWPDGRVVSLPSIQKEIRKYMVKLGFDPSKYRGMSWRAGGCQSAENAGIAKKDMLGLGRWSTVAAMEHYHHTNFARLAKFTGWMMTGVKPVGLHT